MAMVRAVTGSQDQQDARAALADAIRRVGEADRAALRVVHDRTVAKLYGICLRILGDPSAAEDVVQDVYLKLWQGAARRFDASRASPITWLAAIARNNAIDRVRSAGARRIEPVDAIADMPDDRQLAPDVLIAAQASDRIHHCLDELETRPREAIRTAFFEGLAYSELAERMGAPLGTIKSWVRRGLIRLRDCVGDG